MFMKLETLLQEVNVNDDTDYFQLYTMIELMDIVVGSERLQPPEKVCTHWPSFIVCSALVWYF